jgi:hypothetical protein
MTQIWRPAPEVETWWGAYEHFLAAAGFSQRSREVLDMDADYIVRNGVFPPVGAADPAGLRSGLVMGAVQSGKTASMLAVATKALDAGVDCVVILAGTRTSLWRQTFDRLTEQVDRLSNPTVHRVLVPDRSHIRSEGATSLSTLYDVSPPLAAKLVMKRRPLVAVVMKHVAHLERFAETLDSIYRHAEARGDAFRILVIDDEADDSSVVDTGGLPIGDDASVQAKQVPLRIVDLWATRKAPLEPKFPELRATYLAYTATPQANFLQDPLNPLAPRDFVASLRTPGATGDFEIRSSSYRDPAGPMGWYTGGDVYYRLLRDVPLCVEADDSDEALRTAIRAYLVACAVRLVRTGAMGPNSAENHAFESQASAALSPMSMLVHPSSAKDDHFAIAQRVLSWAAGDGAGTGDLEDDSHGRRLGVGGLLADLEESDTEWRRWLDQYAESAVEVQRALGFAEAPSVPGQDSWASIRDLLVNEVIPGTRVAVINSDENADDRPDFAPWHDGSVWRSPRNLSTIFVSGNVMSRGLTLEGLTTTLFSRSSGTELADTQMQMQRWFGYRAKIIDLCRVFTSDRQISLFGQYHENDEALRRDVLAAMVDGQAPPDIQILQGRSFKATGKISNIQGIPLYPGSRPFVRHLTAPEIDDANIRMIAELFGDDPFVVDGPTGARGLLLKEAVTLDDAALLLERLSYPDHGPGLEGREASRWASVANHAGLSAQDPRTPLYRAPSVPNSRELGLTSPYAIAAYLRLWAACLQLHVPGMVSTDEPPVPWSLVDLEARLSHQPKFWVGLRFGEGPTVGDGPLATLSVPARTMARGLNEGALAATWGARGSGAGGVIGDDQFDTLMTGEPLSLTTSGARPAGSNGLILFHLVDRGEGLASLAVGLSIPIGGPDHVEAHVQRQ